MMDSILLYTKLYLVCLQYLLLLSGHLFKYWASSSLLNFSALVRTDAFSVTWLLIMMDPILINEFKLDMNSFNIYFDPKFKHISIIFILDFMEYCSVFSKCIYQLSLLPFSIPALLPFSPFSPSSLLLLFSLLLLLLLSSLSASLYLALFFLLFSPSTSFLLSLSHSLPSLHFLPLSPPSLPVLTYPSCSFSFSSSCSLHFLFLAIFPLTPFSLFFLHLLSFSL